MLFILFILYIKPLLKKSNLITRFNYINNVIILRYNKTIIKTFYFLIKNVSNILI